MTTYVTRLAAIFHLDSGRVAVVRDNVDYTADVTLPDGTVEVITFLAAPYGSLSNFNSKIGNRADRLRLRLDGAHIISGPDGEGDADSALQAIFDEPLRNRRVDIYRLDLDTDTMEVARVKHKWVGRVDDVDIDRSDPSKPQSNIQLLSYRVHAARPEATVYSDVDQRSMYPDDGIFKHLEDNVFRNGEFRWNQEAASGGGGGGGGPRDRGPRVPTQLR